jgi:PTS system fructose-specific IIC component/PTS system nitrogen regulatory IIA component
MLLDQIFPVNCIKLSLESETKDELFAELVRVFNQSHPDLEADGEELVRAIQERESLMSTGIKRGIAIPHGKSNSLKGIYGILGISRKGIAYQSLDGEPVNLVFLLLSSKAESEKHLRVLKTLAVLLESETFLSDLVAAPTAQAASDILAKYESELITGE